VCSTEAWRSTIRKSAASSRVASAAAAPGTTCPSSPGCKPRLWAVRLLRQAAIRKRLDVHHAQTKQLAEYYSAWANTGDPRAPKYRKVDGSGNIEEVHKRIFAVLA